MERGKRDFAFIGRKMKRREKKRGFPSGNAAKRCVSSIHGTQLLIMYINKERVPRRV